MGPELSHFLGRERRERKGNPSNHRNDSYHRNFTLKGIGEIQVRVPRDRRGRFRTKVFPRSKQYESAVTRNLSLMFLTGTSLRSLSLFANHLLGQTISHTEINQANKELRESIEKWRQKDLSRKGVRYLFMDGVHFSMRAEGKVENIPLLVAVGVTEQGTKLVWGLQMGDKKSASSWRELFKDLKKRGLDGSKVILEDGLAGIGEGFPGRVSPCPGTAMPSARRSQCVGQASPEAERQADSWFTIHFLCFLEREIPGLL